MVASRIFCLDDDAHDVVVIHRRISGRFKVGKTKKPGSLVFAYNYREIEADAVLGVWTDADYIGGGMDGESHKFSIGCQLTQLLTEPATSFMSEKGLDDDSKDYDRLQVDVSAKF